MLIYIHSNYKNYTGQERNLHSMRILLIRHGDPDYENDTLTEKGCREAELLAKRALSLHMGKCYVSPLGRAQRTALPSLEAAGCKAETVEWLQEFPAKLDVNKAPELAEAYPDIEKEGEKYRPRIVWDMAPGYLTEHEEYMDKINWRHSLVAKCSDMEDVYDKVTKEFDTLLAKHGYVRENGYYRVEKESTETITLFCHFGLICVLLSHLWNVSPFTLWNSFALAPTSVTEVVTEERKQGIAYFRGLKIGDISHLYAGNEEPSFAARFCETYSNKEQRH